MALLPRLTPLSRATRTGSALGAPSARATTRRHRRRRATREPRWRPGAERPAAAAAAGRARSCGPADSCTTVRTAASPAGLPRRGSLGAGGRRASAAAKLRPIRLPRLYPLLRPQSGAAARLGATAPRALPRRRPAVPPASAAGVSSPSEYVHTMP